MSSNDSTGIFIAFTVIGGILLISLILTFKLWLFGSLAVSSIKTLSDDCGKTYPMEVYVINGDWFCPEVKVPNE